MGPWISRAPLGWISPIILSMLAGACGGGSSPTPPPTPPAPPTPAPATIDIPAGRAALGLVSEGAVRFLAVAAGGEENELAAAETGDDGRFAEREVETDHTGPLRINVGPNDGGTSRYLCDLLDGCVDRDGMRAAFGETLPLSATLSAAVSSASGASGTINITPFTTAAVERAITLGGLTAANIDRANREMAEALEEVLSHITQRDDLDLGDDPGMISIVDLTDAPNRIAADHTDIEFLVAILHAGLLALADGEADDDAVRVLAAAFAESGSLTANDTVAGEETVDVADLLRVAMGELEALLANAERRDHVRQLLGFDSTAEGDAMLDRMRDLVVTYEGVGDTIGLAQVDSDGDGLPDLDEIGDGLDPQNPDSDGDTVADGRDPFPLDGRRTVEPDVFPPARDFAARCANPRSGNFPDRPGTFVDENNWLRSWSNNLYLWYDEIVDVDPVLHSTPRYFDIMRTFATTPSGADRDRFHFTYPTDEWEQLAQSGVSAGYGIGFAILARRPPRDVRIAYIEPGSPAARANLGRGARILTADGANVAFGSASVLNAAFFPADIGETHEFEVRDLDADAPRTVALTSAVVTSDPVQDNRIIETASGSVGYMVFNDHIATAERELADAVTEFAEAGIDDLVLDLRYNGGGYLAIASRMAYMIAGTPARGRTFEELQFNDKHRTFNPVTGRALSPTPFYDTTYFALPRGDPLPSLDLSRVFVLTGGGTCSASETIINGLRGIDLEVIQIGTTTCGKPYGFYPTDNCGTTYFSIQFQGVNAKGFGDYPDGFSPQNTARIEGVSVPGCVVGDDFEHALGDVEEARLKVALQYRIDATCPTPAAVRSARPTGGSLLPTTVDAIVPKSIWLQNRW